jgi:four helix bundle protein
MNPDELKKRTNEFAHRCVKLALTLPNTTLGNHLARQLIRSSTSVAANYRAACVSQSRTSFAAKISIVLEETDESYFWIEFIVDEDLVARNRVLEILAEADELTRIFAASRKRAQQREINLIG